MKIKTADIDRLAKKPEYRFILFYGPDRGRAGLLGQTAVKALADDARIFDGDIAKADADTVLTAARAGMSLFGSTHALRLRDIGDKSVAIVSEIIALGEAAVPLVVETGDLKPSSKLRKLFETSEHAAAAALYLPERRDLVSMTRDAFKENGIQAGTDAIERVADLLPSDTLQAKAEIDRFAVWASGRGTIDVEAVERGFSDRADFEVMDLAAAAALGDAGGALRMISRLREESAVGLVRQTQWHFQRLLEARAAMENGAAAKTAMSKLKPPVFFKQAATFERQLKRWRPKQIERALGRLVEAEQQLKSTGYPERETLGQCFLDIAMMKETA